MKLQIQRQDIKPAIDKLAKLANGKHKTDALNHIKLETADDGTLELTANDTTKTMSERVEYQGDNVSTCLYGPKLAKAINSFKAGEIEIVQDATTTKLKQNRSQIKIDALPTDQFPTYDLADQQWTVCDVDSDELRAALKTVKHAMAEHDVRPYMNGIYLTEGHAVATDGYRLARSALNYKGHSLIIPCESVPQLINAQGHAQSCETQFRVASQTEQFVTRTIEGKFPDWAKLFSESELTNLYCDKSALEDAVKRSEISGDKVRITSDASGGTLHVGNDGANTELDAKCDADIQATAKAEYLLDVLSTLPGNEVQLSVNAENMKIFINDDFIVMGVRE